jgi:hypothetical protein
MVVAVVAAAANPVFCENPALVNIKLVAIYKYIYLFLYI